jgi:hypothetical protein
MSRLFQPCSRKGLVLVLVTSVSKPQAIKNIQEPSMLAYLGSSFVECEVIVAIVPSKNRFRIDRLIKQDFLDTYTIGLFLACFEVDLVKVF